MYEDGSRLKDIAKIVGCSEKTVSTFLIKHGVKTRSTGVKSKIYPIGFVIGNWRVISEKRVNSKQLCKCNICGHEQYIEISKVISRPSKRCVKCKSSKFVNDIGDINYLYIMSRICERIKYNSERRGKSKSIGL